jgi:hypothetical protein
VKTIAGAGRGIDLVDARDGAAQDIFRPVKKSGGMQDADRNTITTARSSGNGYRNGFEEGSGESGSKRDTKRPKPVIRAIHDTRQSIRT